MTDTPLPRPWEELDAIAQTGDSERLKDFLNSLSPSEAARAISHLAVAEGGRVLRTLAPDGAADLLETLPTSQSATLIESLSADAAAAILHELPSYEQADLVVELAESDAAAILAELDPEEARDIRALAQYPEHHAGGLMQTEVIALAATSSVTDAIARFRTARMETGVEVQYLYVLDRGGRLVGVVPLRDLLTSSGAAVLGSIMIPDPVSAAADAELGDLEDLFASTGRRRAP